MAEWERQYGAAWRAFYGQVEVIIALPCCVAAGSRDVLGRSLLTMPICAGLCAASAAFREGSSVGQENIDCTIQ